MFRKFFILFIVLLLCLSGCKEGEHFIKDPSYREKVEKQFQKQKELATHRSAQLFGVFEQDLSQTEEEALKFLFAFMPLSDLADYDGGFFLKNVRSSLAARDTFPWGKTVPEAIFRHFVLPIRVNNENLDSSRWIFYTELKDRIKNLSMKDALLEVNHWCHEKVTYKGTDIRTSSPLATVKTAFGRCGEESTFTTAALRAVGIPARQCYTPRWAHGDDNHAWVEVWIDGKWHYIGACEPEPDVDMAWFTIPATRAMLVNTNVFGLYQGPEDILLQDERFTRINILPNYAPVKRIYVHLADAFGRPADRVKVEFQLYNYAEFYPLYTTLTDDKGRCTFLTGNGDLLVWAAKEGLYTYKKITVGSDDTVHLQLHQKPGQEYQESFDLIPPPPQSKTVILSDSLKNLNDRRLAFEDQLRAAYQKTFIDSSIAFRLSGNLQIDGDTLWHFLRQSCGNWREIVSLIAETPVDQKSLIFPLLSVISSKDLRDADPESLLEHLTRSTFYEPLSKERELFESYILNPRIDNEMIRPWRRLFQSAFDTTFIFDCRRDPAKIDTWLKEHIRIDEKANWGRAPLSPAGIYNLKVTDPHSYDILFVALCRSFGIPARLEPATRIPQFYLNGTWNELNPKTKPVPSERGQIILENDPANKLIPEYFTHFTLEQYKEGFFRSLDYESSHLLKNFPALLEVPAGYYLLVTGSRVKDGSVQANLNFFSVTSTGRITKVLTLRKDSAPRSVLGRVDLKGLLDDLDMGKPVKVAQGKPIIMAWLEPDREPTKHFIKDLKVKKEFFEESGAVILLLFRNNSERTDFMSNNGNTLPGQIQYITVNPAAIGDINTVVKKKTGQHLPVVVFIAASGDILYLSEGYRIGSGNELAGLLK